MKFFPLSLNAQSGLSLFYQRCQVPHGEIGKVFPKKINACDCDVLLIAKDDLDLDLAGKSPIDLKILKTLSEAWVGLDGYETNAIIENIGMGVPINYIHGDLISRILWRFKKKHGEKKYFLLLTGKEPLGLPVFELMVLSNLWQMDQGCLPIHASGVLHDNHVYLFGGPSGAGKSTIAYMSQHLGDAIIDEDQVLVHRNKKNIYTVDGWGYDVFICDKPLKAAFQIFQDTHDRLIPMTQSQAARFFLERNAESLGGGLSDNLLQALRLSSNIARQIPVYELHFRKSHDFWKLIDAEFPD